MYTDTNAYWIIGLTYYTIVVCAGIQTGFKLMGLQIYFGTNKNCWSYEFEYLAESFNCDELSKNLGIS